MFTEPPIAVPLQWYKPAEQANFLGKHKVGKLSLLGLQTKHAMLIIKAFTYFL